MSAARPRAAAAVTVTDADADADAVIVGAGFAGLLTAAHLLRAGLTDIRVVDAADDVGGVWHSNRYPGAQCDVDGYCYLPLLEETGYIPSEKYPHAPEIHAHARRIATHLHLYERALFGTRVQRMTWNEATGRWTVHTDRGHRITARYVVLATGVFVEPRPAPLTDLASFTGHHFHANRWDYHYTGGDERGHLNRLTDKTVAVVGTGATAVQIIPHLGASAGALLIFQRTPATVGIRGNRPTDPTWVATLEPGWQKRRIHNFTEHTEGTLGAADLVDDGWSNLYRTLRTRTTPHDDPLRWRVDGHRLHAHLSRPRVSRIVTDPATARSATPAPDSPARPCFHDQYLPTLNNPNTTLIDCGPPGLDRCYDAGVIAHGRRYPVDCIVFATGFDRTAPTDHLTPQIIGTDGRPLTHWWTTGPTSLHGVLTHGFPNLFFNGFLDGHGTRTLNITHVLDEIAEHIAAIVTETHHRATTVCEVSEHAQTHWTETIETAAHHRTPALYPAPPTHFFALLRTWRAHHFDGLEFRNPP
ncbi:NAD(P)/FAD-dependent oxidoreductase [Rhodococcus cerastii]|nr:NAD(P)/FAD-dependent oxidoreductase [Rhodococcus cerastii]